MFWGKDLRCGMDTCSSIPHLTPDARHYDKNCIHTCACISICIDAVLVRSYQSGMRVRGSNIYNTVTTKGVFGLPLRVVQGCSAAGQRM